MERKFPLKYIFYLVCLLSALGLIVLFVLGLVFNYQLNIEDMGHQIEEFGFYKKDVHSAWFYNSGAYKLDLRNKWFIIGGILGFAASCATMMVGAAVNGDLE